MTWILNLISQFLTVREIYREDGKLYLSRFRLMGWMPGSAWRWPLSIYLHHFHTPDMDDAPHNHPWKWAFSIILCGGYWEYKLRPGVFSHKLWRGAIGFNWISHADYHRVTEMRFRKDTWTLFFAGPKATSWGFWVPGRGHVEWRARLAERGIPAPDATHEEV